ncbi:MAG: hypothetical protein M1828_000379 [Chrysothrix sp. TS-e1954]|nr:MAG: hypothetical protein M1828_000379 [Chrysothrix sp. TS-e1954]
MADRFPSIEDIDEGNTSAAPAVDDDADLLDGGNDTGDFLSRERAALGADADQFSMAQDGAPFIQSNDVDLMGEGRTNGTSDEMNKFQNSYPPVSSRNNSMAPGGTTTSSTNRAFSPAPPTSAVPPEEEPSVIKEWRERRSHAIDSREEAAGGRKEETVKNAQQAIDEFYENYNQKKEKQLVQTRKEAEEFLAKREDTTAGGTSWERISKLVDVRGAKGGAVGKEKFRDLLVGLTKDKEAPGAKGY